MIFRQAATALVCSALLSLSCAAAPAVEHGRASQIDVPAGTLDEALRGFARQTDQQILFSPELTRGKTSAGIHGIFQPAAALDKLLESSGLVYRMAGNVIVVSLADPTDLKQSGFAETIIVTGFRASLEKSLELKRSTSEMIDAIYTEDIGKFPDSNLAESLQRLPGVAVDRENGEGRTITVRGLNASFTRVTLNGLQTLATAGASNGAGNAPNRDRGFDFNTFASELFGSLIVQKSASGATEEGSLGATVSLSTPRPFDQGGSERYLLSLQNAWYEIGKPFNPRIAALVSKTILGGRVGILGSVAYSSKGTASDTYQRSAGDFVYRGMNFATSNPISGFDNGSILGRDGFAAPIGSNCDGTVAPYSNGVVPGNLITNAAYCAALSGSDPTAYALVNSPQGRTITDTNAAVGSTASRVTAPASVIIVPKLPTLSHNQTYSSKLGLTGAVQWQVDDSTLLTFDGLFSSAYQSTLMLSITPVGLNRGATSATLNTASAGTADATLLGMYPYHCTAQGDVSTIGLPQAPVDCGQALYGNTLLADTATTYSYNPYNLDVYDYYASAYSAAHNYPGASKTAAIANAISLVGMPATKVKRAKVENGVATFIQLDNVDWRTLSDQVYYGTQFEQLNTNFKRDFGDRFKVEVTAGWSRSYNHQVGYLVSFDSMDVHKDSYFVGDVPNATGYMTYDATAGGDMPKFDLGFDAANPAMWSFVKGFSSLRHYEYQVKNTYRTVAADASLMLSDQFGLRFGGNARIFDFYTSHFTRAIRDVLNPSLSEGGVTSADVSQLVTLVLGLNAPAGTINSFVAPDLNKFKRVFGFDCNCINKYGDWRISNLFNPSTSGVPGSTYTVSEHSKSVYLQLVFNNAEILGRPLHGNVGTRMVFTDVISRGHALAGQPIDDSYSYTDFLPSANIIYDLTDDMMLRGAASLNMARPSLVLMAPSITAFSPPTSSARSLDSTGSMTLGNTHLRPYRAKSIDIGWEWYFDKEALLSVTGFVKWIKDNPQQVITTGRLSNFLPLSTIDTLKTQYSALCTSVGGTVDTLVANCNALYYINNDFTTTATQPLNGLGGVMQGVEINYQQHLEFIPAVLGGSGFGLTANLTHIMSKQHYIINATLTSITTADAAWPGTSPDTANLTVYYDGDDWSGRVSSAYRSAYISQFPIASGSSVPGYDNSPMVNDFIKSRPTLNVDAKFTYELNDFMQVSVDALNLTNQPDRRFAFTANPLVTNYASTGRSVFIGVRLKN